MIDWWGPIDYEYYAGTEMNGFVCCDSYEWMAHPGTVGRAILGKIHICDASGRELPNAQHGSVYFEREVMPFEYHNDADKTRAAQHPVHRNWSTLGDIGYLDDDDYLFLTDRSTYMIISGGVNIYPQEIENQLVMHPKVADVAVFGIPDADFGEQVKAVVQPESGVLGSEELAAELLKWLQGRIANYKIPRSMEFVEQLPRLPTGKLHKKLLRDEYWIDNPGHRG